MKAVYVIAGISIVLNILLILFLFNSEPSNTPKSLGIQQFEEKYPFLSPSLSYRNQEDVIVNFTPLRTSLDEYVKKNNLEDKVGLYFQMLTSGITVGVSEKKTFILASLLKVPMVMAAYREIERGSMHLGDLYNITEEERDKGFGDLWTKPSGTKITLREAINETIVHSDNTAKNVIAHHLPAGALEAVFDELDIPKELGPDSLAVVSPKNYLSILRSLYTSSFLTKEHSNEILSLMSQTPFNDKMVAGIPPGIRIAHKIGVHYNTDNDPKNDVYTDCGIIYAPARPYMLCIMTQSTNEKAQIIMSDLSKIIYDYVAQQ